MAGIYEPTSRAAEYSLLAVNHYTGCPHRCNYCYVPRTLHISPGEFHSRVEPRKDIVRIVGKQAARLAGTDKRVMLSFACDPYPDVEARLHLTRDVLRILVKNDVPFQVLTKAGQLAYRDFALYRRGLDAFAVTLTTLDDETAAAIEPGAAPPTERIEMLQAAHERGIETWVSLEPVIDPNQSLELIEKAHASVDHFMLGKLNHAPSDVNWAAYGRAAVERCEALGCTYYVKKDLAEAMVAAGFDQFNNTDIRTVSR